MPRITLHSCLFLALATLTGCPQTPITSASSTLGDDIGDSDTGEEVIDDPRTYFIGESTKFDGGGGCNNSDLIYVTSTLRNRLDDEDWSGQRLVDDNSWPEDFQESTLIALGLDGAFGDTARLAVYAGHGNPAGLQWGRPSPNGTCQLNFSTDLRLGTLAGDTAAVVMLMTSCGMRTDKIWNTFKTSASRQFLGYHNSPYIGYDEARKVYKRTQDGQSTADAWLDEMEQNADIGKNSPVVATFGGPADEALAAHGYANLANGNGYIVNVEDPVANLYFEWLNNGCEPKCGNCVSGAISLPQITTGTSLPMVALARPVRSGVEVADRAIALLATLGVDGVAPSEHSRIGALATEASATSDLLFVRLAEMPQIEVTFDPTADRLWVRDRGALARARRVPGSPDDVAAPVIEERDALIRAEAIRAEFPEFSAPFELTTREAGLASPGQPMPQSIAYEYIFSTTARLDGMRIGGKELRIGVTRLGELSSLMIADIELTLSGDSEISRSIEDALAVLNVDVQTQYPLAVEVEVLDMDVGYALADEQGFGDVEPSLLVDYVIVFEDESGAEIGSRRFPARISLITNTGPESLMGLDPDPDAQKGDARGPN